MSLTNSRSNLKPSGGQLDVVRLPKVWHKAEEAPGKDEVGSIFEILVETHAGDLIEITASFDGEGFVCNGSFPGIPTSGLVYLVPSFFRPKD